MKKNILILIILFSISAIAEVLPDKKKTSPINNSIAAGTYHTCVLINGSVKCWGSNTFGNLGDGTNLNRETVTQVVGLTSGVQSISISSTHDCALINGIVKCWGGSNSFNELGINNNVFQNLATPINGLTNVQVISAGSNYTCALVNGRVSCWGRNEHGNLGDGTFLNKKNPAQVVGLTSGVQAISTGSYHTCVLLVNSSVKCWGGNEMGRLGDGTSINKNIPTQVTNLTSSVIAIATGNYHSCALMDEGGVQCWGYNISTGSGSPKEGTSVNHIPTYVSGLTSGVRAITANGSSHTCALMNYGGVKCWGNNELGQLGDGTNIHRYTPTQVNGLTSGVEAITASPLHTCALMKNGGAKCWGNNTHGQLGDGTKKDSNTPVNVVGL